jgi:hypothetical protein
VCDRGSKEYVWCDCFITSVMCVLILFSNLCSSECNLDCGACVQGVFGCFSQNLPKGEIVNSLYL